MASVKVAVRVRPFNQREKDMNAKLIVQMEGKKTRLLTVKDPTIAPGLTHPIDFNEVVSIPTWVTRGAGASTHHEYEVRICLGPHQRWQLLRRYRRFRDLYLTMRRLYGPKVASIPFPSRQLWSSEGVARSRRPALEAFLRRLLTVCSTDKRCPFHAAPLTRDTLVNFSPFFRKGVFESGKCGTG
ncbi:kinesin-like protein Klp98A [Hyposmocoma kahamanoa]|uniref:kinesin-like protein Klp98A n=1 Tax=Hyposmocoma kahamanoa TaxID=1477025 RepID=UPI000E6D6246|nr:kinesin-like protein Klp98A [Hyposmocoma kahamanoa]